MLSLATRSAKKQLDVLLPSADRICAGVLSVIVLFSSEVVHFVLLLIALTATMTEYSDH